MPNYKGHLVGGVVAFLLVINVIIVQKVSLVVALEWLSFTSLGALFPDIDIKSKGQKIFYKVLVLVFLILLLKQRFMTIVFLSLLAFLPLVVRHRGMCHELWFVVSAPLVVAFALTCYFPKFSSFVLWDALFFIVGAVSHLYLDFGVKRMLRIR